MFVGNSLGIVYALAASLIWGGADFNGGLASRRSNVFQVLVLSTFSGIILLILGVIWRAETPPSWTTIAWAASAGFFGSLGLACLYQAISLGNIATVAPTAAVIGAAIPVLFGILSAGIPHPWQLSGFALAFAGIWLVTKPAISAVKGSSRGILLAWAAGINFGLFFILIAQVDTSKLFFSLIVTRTVSLTIAVIMLKARHLPMPALKSNPIALVAGVLDALGNILFMLAKQNARLDVATVLSSLYPVVTVILAYLVLKEAISRPQWVGAGLCFIAIAMISV
jgi:drug/metabolite transporter (DMT)-like permease